MEEAEKGTFTDPAAQRDELLPNNTEKPGMGGWGGRGGRGCGERGGRGGLVGECECGCVDRVG